MNSIALLASRFRLALVALALASAASGCVVDAPEEQWDDAGSFGWPTKLGTTMLYKVDSRGFNKSDTTIAEIKAATFERNGMAMYRIATSSSKGSSGTVSTHLLFLPTRDTLFTERGLSHENGLKATYALIAPLDRGKSWVAAYADGTDSATVRATIIERYSQWKLEGKTYENVVAVRYRGIDPNDPYEWIRFYAKGIGPILTVKNVYPHSDYPIQAPPEESDRAQLIDVLPGE